MKIQLPERVSRIIQTLEAAGYEAYAVGGCVRDSVLGREPADWDITTSALPYQVKELFYRTIDTGIEHGTVTVMMDREGFEVTTYRIDGEYCDHRHPKQVNFTGELREDLQRRDFTINALYVDSFLNLIDPSRLGLADIKNRLIRMIGNPDFRLKEDPLRMIRAYRFSLELGFILESSLEESILRNLELIHRLKPVKIKEEINKLSNQHKDELIRKLLLEEIYYQDC